MTIDLLDRCGESVPLDVQEQGYDLADDGEVELFSSSPGIRFLALVFDPELEEPQAVKITWVRQAPGALAVACTCKNVQNWRGCEHVWGALVQMSRQGHSREIPGRAALHLTSTQLDAKANFELLPKLLDLSQDPRAAKVKRPTLPQPERQFYAPYFPELGSSWSSQPMRPTPLRPPATSAPPASQAASTTAGPPATSATYSPPPHAGRASATTKTRVKRPTFVLPPPQPPPPPPEPPKADWRRQLALVIPPRAQHEPKRPRRIYYSLGNFSIYYKTWEVEFWKQELLMNGSWGVIKTAVLVENELADLEPEEELLVRRLLEAHREPWSAPPENHLRARIVSIPGSVLPLLLPSLVATGRFGKMVHSGSSKKFELWQWDAGGPWRLALEGSEEGEPGSLTLRGRLRRGEEDKPLSRQFEILAGGLYRHGNTLAELEIGSSTRWFHALQVMPEIVVPEKEVPEALTLIAQAQASPAVELDKKWQQRIEEEPPNPALRLTLRAGNSAVPAQLLYLYGGVEAKPDDPRELLFDSGSNKMHRRSRSAEKALEARLPFELDAHGAGDIPTDTFGSLVEELASEGWRIGTADQDVRLGGKFSARVESGIDWFDLAGSLDFADQQVALPSLLKAVREGRGWVNLADGGVGLLPAGWTQRWSALIELSRSKKDFRFDRSQALVLDNLLRGVGDLQTDEVFGRIRDKLRSFDHLEPLQEPPGFLGELRPYQRLGLAWLELLADLRLGGCLADDMGLGKTVQVLAWLLRRKQQGLGEGKPCLLVVPRSLVFNWVAELKRFTPQLSYTVSHGAGRESALEQVAEVDLLITTYGTLVRDVTKLRQGSFDVMVVDEAQAIKNRQTQAAEACAAIPAGLRLALTGTPVENHLGELWSIFDFLNPGLLGSLPRISKYAGKLKLPPAALADVARALRPLILRRKKSEVLRDLPAKTEQTLRCELGKEERRRYDELRRYYQASLQKKISEVGLDRAKMWVLEALLRLRQAACHPGLIDKDAQDQSSAKLDALLAMLEQVLEEGHKAIVFSQFTSLLAILKRQLDARGQTYEYLDGKTRDREAKVVRFQNDPELRLFLISLKAGGVGLNLTAASYVFLLDPWWNPAVEAQAIDRAHRIGQDQPVFAYRIIAEGTVEEKILELQQEKRALADAIVAEDQRVLKQLTAADLEQLLG